MIETIKLLASTVKLLGAMAYWQSRLGWLKFKERRGL